MLGHAGRIVNQFGQAASTIARVAGPRDHPQAT
jgi:hypothetical protein